MRSSLLCAIAGLALGVGCVRATHIVLEPKEPVLRTRSESVQMIAHVMTPHTEDAEAKVTWSVEDSSIAKVSDTGLVQGLASGRTNIVATYGSLVAKIPLDVRFVEKLHTEVQKVELSREKGDSFKPDIVVTSYDGLPLKDRVFDYSVKDSNICSVDKSGQFWPVNEGDTVVTATVDHHSIDIPCSVTK